MFIRVKTSTTNDLNVNIHQIKHFAPSSEGGSVLEMVGGTEIITTDSTRSIRGYVKKALFATHTGGAGPDEPAA